MLDMLTMIENSPVSKTAIEAACSLSAANRVQPIYATPTTGHDLSMGAGWAWKTWERENRHRARKEVTHLVSVQRRQFPNLMPPVVVSGRPIKSVVGRLQSGRHDLIVSGVPFRGMPAEVLAHRLQGAVRNTTRDIPLLAVRSFRPIRTVTALTDGSDPAEKALGVLNRMMGHPKATQIFLVALNAHTPSLSDRGTLNLERGFAILKEKGLHAKGETLKRMGTMALKSEIARTDLLVLPFSPGPCRDIFKRLGKLPPAVLIFIDRKST